MNRLSDKHLIALSVSFGIMGLLFTIIGKTIISNCISYIFYGVAAVAIITYGIRALRDEGPENIPPKTNNQERPSTNITYVTNNIGAQSRYRCIRCGSHNVSVQVISDTQLKRKHHGCIYWILIGWWLEFIMWFFLTIPRLLFALYGGKRYKLKTTHKSIRVCQNCGFRW